MIKLLKEGRPFPRPAGHAARANSWGSQWSHLPRAMRALVSKSGRLAKLGEG